jgi:ribosomal protein S18 acetylase RimI-like enzyme
MAQLENTMLQIRTEDDLKIREARIEDSAGLARVQVDSYRTAYVGILPDEYLAHFTYEDQEQDWRDLLASETSDILLLLTEAHDGGIAGYALGRLGASDIAPYESELVSLHVRHPLQKHGIGCALVAAMAERFRTQGCSSLMLWVAKENVSARRFYERLGGQSIGEHTIDLGEGDVKLTEVAYGWPDTGSLSCE